MEASSPLVPIPEYKPPDFKPNIIILISGKRKSGKDHWTGLLEKKIEGEGISVGILRMANPIKHYWATKHGLDYSKLLDSSSYKELHRLGMADWSVQHRKETIGYFCHQAIRMDGAIGKEVWICADMRHTQDMDWFLKYYPGIVKRIRIEANENVRKMRGWVYTEGIDDGPTECELDHIQNWDSVITNNASDDRDLEIGINTILNWVKDSNHGTND